MIVIPFSFYVASAVTAQTATAMATAGEATAGDVPQQPLPWPADIVGMSIQTEAARTAGTCALRPTINGTASAQALTLNATNTQYLVERWSLNSYHIEQGQRLGCVYTTSTDWAAGTTPSVRAVVFVAIDPAVIGR